MLTNFFADASVNVGMLTNFFADASVNVKNYQPKDGST
jgi:hypothetical protein